VADDEGDTVNPPVTAGRRSERAEPRCPDCGIQGMEHIVSRRSRRSARSPHPLFVVVHCAGCGHVYDVVAKHVFTVPVTPRLVLPDLSDSR